METNLSSMYFLAPWKMLWMLPMYTEVEIMVFHVSYASEVAEYIFAYGSEHIIICCPAPDTKKKKKVQIGAGWQSGTLKWWGKYEIVSKNGESPVWASLLWNLIFCFISVGPLGKKILGFLLFYYYFLNIRYFLPPRWKLLLTEQEGQRLWCWKMFQAPSISPSKPPKQPTKCVLILQEARDESLCG